MAMTSRNPNHPQALGLDDIANHVPFISIIPGQAPLHGVFTSSPMAGAREHETVANAVFAHSKYASIVSLEWLGILPQNVDGEWPSSYTLLDDVESYD